MCVFDGIAKIAAVSAGVDKHAFVNRGNCPWQHPACWLRGSRAHKNGSVISDQREVLSVHMAPQHDTTCPMLLSCQTMLGSTLPSFTRYIAADATFPSAHQVRKWRLFASNRLLEKFGGVMTHNLPVPAVVCGEQARAVRVSLSL